MVDAWPSTGFVRIFLIVSLVQGRFKAQEVHTVFIVPTGGLAVMPEGFSRGRDELFTATQLPEGTEDTAAAQILHQAKSTPFVAFHPTFAELTGPDPRIRVLAERDYNFAFEGSRFLEASNEVFFISNYLKDNVGTTYTDMYAINIDSGVVRQIPSCPQATTPGGATKYKGKMAVLVEGRKQENGTLPGGILQVDPYNGECKWLLDNFLGLQFNSPHGPSATDKGVIFFCDPMIGAAQGLKGPPQLGPYVWRFKPGHSSVPRVVADGFTTPIGTALSPDQKTLFVTENGGMLPTKIAHGPRTIYAYDIVGPEETFLQNKRIFAYTDVGAPGGARLDNFGNLYAGTGDGLSVWNSQGELIGKVLFEGGLNTLTIAGLQQNIVIATQNKKIYRIDFTGKTTNAVSEVSQNG